MLVLPLVVVAPSRTVTTLRQVRPWSWEVARVSRNAPKLVAASEKLALLLLLLLRLLLLVSLLLLPLLLPIFSSSSSSFSSSLTPSSPSRVSKFDRSLYANTNGPLGCNRKSLAAASNVRISEDISRGVVHVFPTSVEMAVYNRMLFAVLRTTSPSSSPPTTTFGRNTAYKPPSPISATVISANKMPFFRSKPKDSCNLVVSHVFPKSELTITPHFLTASAPHLGLNPPSPVPPSRCTPLPYCAKTVPTFTCFIPFTHTGTTQSLFPVSEFASSISTAGPFNVIGAPLKSALFNTRRGVIHSFKVASVLATT